MSSREKTSGLYNRTPLQKIFLLTAEQLARLLGKERERVESLRRESSEALGRAEREVKQHGDSARAYALFRDAQQRHLAEAAREREVPLAIEDVVPGERTSIFLPSVGIETGVAEIAKQPHPSSSPRPTDPSPPTPPSVERRAAAEAKSGDSHVKRTVPWLLRSRTKFSRAN